MSGWRVVLEGVTLSGGDEEGSGCLTVPPDGMGLPPMRVEDVAYPQRDGVRHFSDWYEPRIITLEEVMVCGDGCPGCTTAREKVRDIMQAWSRKCEDVELVIHTDCGSSGEEVVGFGEGGFGEGPFGGTSTVADRALTGPYGVIGRPRVASMQWLGQGSSCAVLLLRFDSVDHRLYILDAEGNPGSGTECITLTPDVDVFCREYPRCYDMCYDNDISEPGAGPVSSTIEGNVCAYPTITLIGPLTNPVIENVDTGETLTYAGIVPAGVEIVIDTYIGTAMQGTSSRTHLLEGAVRFPLDPGPFTLRLSSSGVSDSGEVEVCWRPAVLSG